MRRFDDQDAPYGKTAYRLWSIARVQRDDEEFEEVVKYMPVTPLQVILLAGGLVGLYYSFSLSLPQSSSTFAALVWSIVTSGVIVAVIFSLLTYLKKTAPVREEKRQRKVEEAKERRATQRELARQWMLDNFDLSHRTDEVHLDRLPTPLDLQGKVVQRFRISYWTFKAALCKPFSE